MTITEPFLLALAQVLVNFLVMTAPTTQAQSCGPRVSPRLLMEIPCDMTKSLYCSIPGSAYPWHSVRRYIYENQGLMKRMYGDQRHSLILQNEIENRRAKYDFNFFDRRGNGGGSAGESGRSFFERAETLTSASPTTTTSTTNSPPTGPVNPNHYYSPPFLQSVPESSVTTSGFDPHHTTGKMPGEGSTGDDSAEDTILDFAAENFLTTAPGDSTIPTAFAGQEPPSTGVHQETTMHTTAPFTSTRTATTTGSTSVFSGNFFDSTVTSTGSAQQDHKQGPATTIGSPSSASSPAPPPRDEATSGDLYSEQDANHPKVNIVSLNTLDKDHNGDHDEEKTPAPEMTEPTPRRGMNACPVKEEVIAPYWANNTRGETLALLNVYPFEQYVHWEKCAYENHQMFCRDGCRCEQQYRLHRMLAFDPKNECRGIFADWFRFPSCCVCICYNIPEEVERLFQRGNYRRGRNS